MPQVILVARNDTIGQLIEDYLDKKISYDELGMAIRNLGYSTNSLYEMVMAAKYNRANEEASE